MGTTTVLTKHSKAKQCLFTQNRFSANLGSMTAPKFTTNLYDKTVTERESVVLECAVEADSDPTIKWMCNSLEVKVSILHGVT